MMIISAIGFMGLFGVTILIMIRGRRVMKHIKSSYVSVYKDHFEQRGLLVDTISPNLFLLSSEAQAIAEQDIAFKRLRRAYGLAWLSLPVWIISLLIFALLFCRFIT
jgi:hypothetical protein